jgi:3-methylcrotonyl-CoA carboxylase alpha subunit
VSAAPAVLTITTLLIANRGEIAIRIMRTARRMGLRTVAVYTDDEASAPHVRAADAAVRLPGGTPAASYLDVNAIIAAAKAAGAGAIHPGYGFLAENPDFADACAKAGIVFVGPPAAAMRAVGDKAEARRLAAANKIPVVPGYDGKDQSPEAIAAAADRIGYPLLVKPAAGGGGKGMRIVERRDDLRAAQGAAQREAERAFGDNRLILEKYVANPRHVEVQVLADEHGNVVHVLERDCSIQRRYQKLVEEAPAPGVDPEVLEALRESAVRAARAAAYVNAGTVEFLVAGRQFYFMEMNTRLQVEHPVTEAITGLDLVEWQIRIARREALPWRQADVRGTGHAIEVRLLAEDAANDFVPQTGVIRRLRLPDGLPGIRIDSGVEEGAAVTVHYDSLIAKLSAHGADRKEAIARLRAALAHTAVAGVRTNRTFLAAILEHPDFAAGNIDTGFIAKRREELLTPAKPDRTVAALAAFAAMRLAERAAHRGDDGDAHSPWHDTGGWRLFGRASASLRLAFDRTVTPIGVTYADGGYQLRIGDETVAVSGTLEADGRLMARVRDAAGETARQAFVDLADEQLTVSVDGAEHTLRIDDPRTPAAGSAEVAGARLTSPMPGQVVSVAAAPGKSVAKGDPLVVVEAMKMEHTIAAPRSGRIRAVNVAVGDRVAAGVELVAMDDDT